MPKRSTNKLYNHYITLSLTALSPPSLSTSLYNIYGMHQIPCNLSSRRRRKHCMISKGFKLDLIFMCMFYFLLFKDIVCMIVTNYFCSYRLYDSSFSNQKFLSLRKLIFGYMSSVELSKL